jgi:7tm Odorant receptor
MNISELLKFLSYSSGIFLQIFWPTYFGSEISEESNKIVTSLYECDWSNADIGSKKLIIMLMEMTKKPFKITVASIFHVDLTTFLFVSKLLNCLDCFNTFFFQILKTTYSLVSLARALK